MNTISVHIVNHLALSANANKSIMIRLLLTRRMLGVLPTAHYISPDIDLFSQMEDRQGEHLEQQGKFELGHPLKDAKRVTRPSI